jgi:hypothetical protein
LVRRRRDRCAERPHRQRRQHRRTGLLRARK